MWPWTNVVYHVLITRMHFLLLLWDHRSSLIQQEQTRVCVSPPSSLFFFLPPHHPGDGCIAKWSRSSCITEDTAGTVTTASPAPAVTRSCLMEPASSWTSTPLKMTTCWMGTLPPQVGLTGSTGYQIAPRPFSIIIRALISSNLLCLSIPWLSRELLHLARPCKYVGTRLMSHSVPVSLHLMSHIISLSHLAHGCSHSETHIMFICTVFGYCISFLWLINPSCSFTIYMAALIQSNDMMPLLFTLNPLNPWNLTRPCFLYPYFKTRNSPVLY